MGFDDQDRVKTCPVTGLGAGQEGLFVENEELGEVRVGLGGSCVKFWTC